jgi:hypothetical protein
MSTEGTRIVAFVLNLVFFLALAKCIHESFLTPGMFDWWWVGALASLIGYDQTTRWDERLKRGI